MGEILQDDEQYILQWREESYPKWDGSGYYTYDDALKMGESIVAHEFFYGRKIKFRIIKETRRREVVYDDGEDKDHRRARRIAKAKKFHSLSRS
jgi:hypothetical protein